MMLPLATNTLITQKTLGESDMSKNHNGVQHSLMLSSFNSSINLRD